MLYSMKFGGLVWSIMYFAAVICNCFSQFVLLQLFHCKLGEGRPFQQACMNWQHLKKGILLKTTIKKQPPPKSPKQQTHLVAILNSCRYWHMYWISACYSPPKNLLCIIETSLYCFGWPYWKHSPVKPANRRKLLARWVDWSAFELLHLSSLSFLW